MGNKIRKYTLVLGLFGATALWACEEDDDMYVTFDYCIEAYSDCLDDCRGTGCAGCEAEYNNCTHLSDVYR